MLFKYLIIRFTTVQCYRLVFDMNWLTALITNARSTLIPIIAYMRDPIWSCIKYLPFFLCTFLNSSSKVFNNFKLALNRVLTGLHYFMLKCLRTSLI